MKLRKLFAGVAAAATLLGGMAFGAATANAADDAAATITLNASSTAQLAAGDLKAYRIGAYSNLQYDQDGKVTYADVIAANDAVKGAAAAAAEAAGAKDLANYPDWVAYYAAKTTSYSADLKAFAAELAMNPGATPITNPTLSNDGLTATFSGLESGWYLIVDVQGNPVFVGTKAFNGTDYVDFAASATGDGVADLKPTSTPAPGKTANKTTVTVGDVINYELTGKIPNWNGYQTYAYNFVDTPSDSLTINENSVVVKIDGKDVTKADGVTVTYPTDTVKTLTVAIDATKFTVGAAVEITYTATATAEPENGQYVNDAKITGTVDSKGTKVTVKTTPFNFTKINAEGEGIEGVDFTIAPKEGTAALPQGYKAIVASNADGVVSFAGLADGTYTVTEGTPKAGYMQSVKATFDVTIENGVVAFSTTPTSDPFGLVNKDKKTVLNVKSVTELPKTGAAGVAMFVALGLVLAGAAGTVFAKSRRTSSALHA